MSPRSRLPLNALRVFEAAARRVSFTAAAEELNITPGAVSRQIKALEAELGVRLFDRFNRAVRLTPAGARLAEGVADGLGRLEMAVDKARPRADGPLTVSVLHSFAAKWLVPRIHLFHAQHPGQQVLVSAADMAVDLARDPVDVCIRYGPGPYPGLEAELLVPNVIFPVCSPALLDGPNPLREPADLARFTLLHDNNILPGEPVWPTWLKDQGLEGIDAARGPRFSNTYLSMQAAMTGEGVVLAHQLLVMDDLAAGRLAKPFPGAQPTPFHYWFLCLPERAREPGIRRFRRWLKAQVEADGLAATGFT
jgi:LysR family glycine cleavage system transcriptional activator